MVEIVQIGAGAFANRVHGPMLRRYVDEHPGEVELAAICVRTIVAQAEAYAATHGFRGVYTDVEQMVEKERPDACWVLTNIASTRSAAGAMMEWGVPVLIEKPHSANFAEAEELAAISQRTGTLNLVAFNRRYALAATRAREWMADHAPFERVHATLMRSGRIEDREFAYGTGIHALDFLQMSRGDHLAGLSHATVLRQRAGVGYYNFHVDLAFGSGATGSCELLPNAGINREVYTLLGESSCIEITMPWTGVASKAELWENGELVDSERWSPADHTFAFGFYQEGAQILRPIREGTRPETAVESTVSSVALAEAVQAGVDWQSN